MPIRASRPFQTRKALTYTPAIHQAPGGSHAALAPSEVGPKHHPAQGTAGSHQPLRIHPRCIRTTGVDDCGRPRGNRRHRAEARGKPAERPDQHPGDRTAKGSTSCRSRISLTTSSSCRACRTRALGPGFSLPYFRGVASGENNNHSGPQPTVGMYLDEQPITTIQGSLDIHMYDIQRVEALAGPQGTLYGASSEAGTIRIITNKPDPSGFKAGYNLEVNIVDHGGTGYVAEGFVNLPISHMPQCGWSVGAKTIRLHRQRRWNASYVGPRDHRRDDLHQQRKTPPRAAFRHRQHARTDLQRRRTLRRRAALKVDLNDNWTITPSVMYQKATANGSFAYDPAVGDLELTHFFPDTSDGQVVAGGPHRRGQDRQLRCRLCGRIPEARRCGRCRLFGLHVLLRPPGVSYVAAVLE